MAITRINTVLVKHSRILFGIITIIIIISFVWFFTPGTSGSIFFEGRGNSPNAAVGKVLGEKITVGMLNDARQDYLLFEAMQRGIAPEGINVPTEQAFLLAHMQILADKLGVTVSRKQVGEMLLKAPAFLGSDGKFSQAKYEKYEKECLNPAGFNALDLDRAVRRILTAGTIFRVLGQTSVVPDSEWKAFAQGRLEKFRVRQVEFRFQDAAAGLKFTDKDLQAYHKTNAAKFKTTPRINASVVCFPYASYQKSVRVSESEIKAYYDKNKTEFTVKGKVMTLAQARSRIESKLRQAAVRKAAFAAAENFREKLYSLTGNLSGERSEYVKAFEQGAKAAKLTIVRTGFFKISETNLPKIGPEPALLQALTGAELSRPITSPVEGVRAAFVAVVTGQEAARPATYAEAAADVRRSYIDAKAAARTRENASALAAALAASKQPAKDFAALASKNGKVTAIPVFAPDTLPKELMTSPAPGLALDTPAGMLSRQQETPQGIVMVFVDSRTQPTEQEIAKSADKFKLIYGITKQNMMQEAFRSWIASGTENYLERTR